jgi:pyrroloquinoline quinone biosynthesis protein E
MISLPTKAAPVFRPFGLLAELTYRCPLHCPYCSNPVDLPPAAEELSTEEWKRVLDEAAALGVLHALFSGGEPLLRSDLADLVAAARAAGLYVNLLTSGLGLTPGRLACLQEAGLDSVQISLQADEETLADAVAGGAAHACKLEAARLVRHRGLPLTLNVVLHRGNIDRLAALIDLAERLDAQRLELANTQYYGWAFRNKHALLPGRAQVEAAAEVAAAARKRLGGRMEILFVLPDYFDDRPKPCMNGWGRRFLTVNPVGDVLPCPTAAEIHSLRFDNVRRRPLPWIWNDSEAFNRYRGTAWMPEPCRSCAQREVDFGGCRCQAFLLTGDAGVTDPACSLSPHREALTRVVAAAEAPPLLQQLQFRMNPPR